MMHTLVDRIAHAVLYEGYNLYPYRPSSVKNQRRFNFGVLTPKSYSMVQHGTESCSMQTECLVRMAEHTTLDVTIRFLHLQVRDIEAVVDTHHGDIDGPDFRPVESIEVGGRLFQSWQEGIERSVVVPRMFVSALAEAPEHHAFAFTERSETEALVHPDGRLAGALVRKQSRVEGVVELSADVLENGLARVRVVVRNATPFCDAERRSRDDALMHSLVSAHTVLAAENGAFVSLLEPDDASRERAAECKNIGAWPVLVGESGERNVMLASPIILYDYPTIAPESAGDLFDATEIDEILTLRIMTLTDDEKREMRNLDDRTRHILERTEMLPEEQLLKLHGVLRGLRPRERNTQ